jgi:hypothetical protein
MHVLVTGPSSGRSGLSLMKRQFVLTHTFRQSQISAFLSSWVTTTPSVHMLCPQNQSCLSYFRKDIAHLGVNLLTNFMFCRLCISIYLLKRRTNLVHNLFLVYFLKHLYMFWNWRLWIRASWYNYENNQQDALYRLIYYAKSALHVSGDVFAHHQKHLTVFTISGSVHPNCCRLVSRMSWNCAAWVNTSRYCKYSQVLLMMGKNIARNM